MIKTRVPVWVLLAVIAVTSGLLLWAGPVRAEGSTFEVNTTADPATPATAGCDGTECTLREAVDAANADAGADRITFAPGIAGQTINLSTAGGSFFADEYALKVTSQVTIEGPTEGITIARDTGAPDMITFHVDGNGNLTLSGLTLTNGKARDNGGGINISFGTVALENSTVSGNSAKNGGGIYNYGGTLSVHNSTISGNSACSGGGLANVYGGTTTLQNSTVSANHAKCPTNETYIGFGGGIYNAGNGQGTRLTLTNSTVSGNSSETDGGGIYNSYVAQATLTNSTVSGNSARLAGGIWNGHGARDGNDELTLTNCTVSGNSGSPGGILNWYSSVASLGNTIVAGNGTDLSTAFENRGSFSSRGHNLIGHDEDQTGDGKGDSGLTDGQDGDRVGTSASSLDPRLGPLQDNGGPTKTHALLVDSPAIDAGDDALAASLTTDQRGEGYPRKRGARVDIGAFEVMQNQSPAAQGDAYETPQDKTLTVTAPGVLANDSDPDGDTLVAAKVDGPQSGALALNPDGSFTYTPDAGFVGTDSFIYKAGDGSANSDPATVEISVRDATRPTVLDPVKPTGRRVSPRANVAVTFSEPMDQATLDATTVRLVKRGANRAVGATLRFPSAESVVLDPNKPLRRGATYTATITTGAEDLAGNGLETDRVWSFRVRP